MLWSYTMIRTEMRPLLGYDVSALWGLRSLSCSEVDTQPSLSCSALGFNAHLSFLRLWPVSLSSFTVGVNILQTCLGVCSYRTAVSPGTGRVFQTPGRQQSTCRTHVTIFFYFNLKLQHSKMWKWSERLWTSTSGGQMSPVTVESFLTEHTGGTASQMTTATPVILWPSSLRFSPRACWV